MRRAVFWAVGIFILVGCLAAANLRRDPHAVDVDWQLFRPAPPLVVVEPPTPGTIARTIAAQGVVEPIHEAQVVAQVGGKVAEVRVEDGSIVRQGEILIQLDATLYRKRAEATRTRLDTARTNLKIAEAHLRDIEKDPDAATTPASGLAPANPLAGYPGSLAPPPPGPSKLAAAQNSVDGWKIERDSAEPAAEAAWSDFLRTAIRAPIDGVVEELAVAVGDDVLASPTTSLPANPARPAPSGWPGGIGFGGGNPGPQFAAVAPGPARVLCRLLDPDHLRVRAWIDEADVGLVTPDQPARIFLPDEPAVPVVGRVARVAPRGRPNGEVVSYAATIDLPNSTRHPRVGMRVNVEVEVSRQDTALGVPVQAVMHRKRRDLAPALPSRSGSDAESDSTYVKAVFVLDGDRVRLRPIETGVSDERRVEVRTGVLATDRLVVGPFRALDTLEDGFVVRTEAVPAGVAGLIQGLTAREGRAAR